MLRNFDTRNFLNKSINMNFKNILNKEEQYATLIKIY